MMTSLYQFFVVPTLILYDLHLQALREGSWVLLDEINLAQQSVLEAYTFLFPFCSCMSWSFLFCSFLSSTRVSQSMSLEL